MRQNTVIQPVKSGIGYPLTLSEPTFSEDIALTINPLGEYADNNPCHVHFDARLLFELTVRVTPVAIRAYMALLTRLIRNDQPVYFTSGEMKIAINQCLKSCKVQLAFKELEREKAVFRQKGDYNNFYINPLFAWTGDRMQYFDPATLPLLPEED